MLFPFVLGPVSILLCHAVPLLGPLAVFVSFLIIVSDASSAASMMKQAHPEWSEIAHTAIGAISSAAAAACFLVTIVVVTGGAIWVATHLS